MEKSEEQGRDPGSASGENNQSDRDELREPGVIPEGSAVAPAGDAALDSIPAPKSSIRKGVGSLFEVGLVVILALFIALLLKVYVAEAYEIRGRSMEQSFSEKQRVMVLKAFYDIERGDVIIFSSGTNPRKDLIKRVIGLPGDRVTVINGKVTINGEELDEPYVKKEHRRGNNHVYRETVPDGHYYVLGDNRRDSQDSRVFHSVDASTLKGKVVLLWWPLKELQPF